MTTYTKRSGFLVLSVLLVAASGCGQATVVTDDTGLVDIDGGHDASAPPDDAGPPPVDAGHDAAPPQTCATPGTSEDLPCGMCGTITRFCSADHTWAYGVCTGEHGECMPGTTDTIACGNCGTQTARCDTTCTWDRSAACTGEGACAPGSRTRVGSGCPSGQTQEVLCDATCMLQPTGTCMADGCATPGATDDAPCGMCGRVTRFCGSDHVWQYGICGGEGTCMPGTTGTRACGNCGTQTTLCDASCQPVPGGACAGEGVCAPGAMMSTAVGCPAGQTRVVACGSTCDYTVDVSPCAASHPVDVTVVLDITGSNMAALSDAIAPIRNDCIAPLLAIPDVNVGISFTGEYPITVGAFGEADNHPFIGGVEPTTDATRIAGAITGRGMMTGGDYYDGTLAPLWMLSGGAMELGAIPLTCSTGRTPGGCWRPGAARVVVIHTDSPIHGGPVPMPTGAGVAMPYTGVTPQPVEWPAVRAQLQAQGVTIVWFDSTALAGEPTMQFARILSDLGQPASDLHATRNAGAVTTACGQLVARVRTLAGL